MSNAYTRKKRDKRIYTNTLILDEISIVLAFFSAFVIRFNAIMNWADRDTGIYSSMIVTVLLFAIIIHYFYDRKRPNVVQMDPFDNLVRLSKNRAYLSLLTILYFFVTHRSVLASRIVMGLFLILSAVYGFIIRMIYRKIEKDKWYYIERSNTYKLCLPVNDLGKSIKEIKKSAQERVLVRQGNADDSYTRQVLDRLEKSGIRAFLSIDAAGYEVRSGIATDIDSYMAIPAYIRAERADLFGVHYCIARTEEAVHHVMEHLEELKGRYICFSNVHTSVMAKENRDYADILNAAALIFPDGAPVAEHQRKHGHPDAERVAGPDFMEHMFSDTTDGRIGHFFYGSTDETLTALKKNLLERYPGISIKGMYSPPFRPLTEDEDQRDVDMINASGADIVWIGLGAPKQEKWMNAHQGRINAVMMGVGAGFDFHAGTIQRAPYWLQRVGLEWLYRLFKDPKRLFKRYIVTNIKFIYYVLFRK